MQRRWILKLIGGGTILAAAGAGAGYLATRTPTEALAPWSKAGTAYHEPRMRALSYAILAPNPHNRQPWLIDLSKENKILIYADTAKLLPHTDPLNRQITIGMGCFLELLRMAAADDGYKVTFTLFPEGWNDAALDARPVAEIHFQKDATTLKDPLFVHALQRRSLKEPFDTEKAIPDTDLQALLNVGIAGTHIGTSNNSDDISLLRELTHKAMAVEIETPRTYQESVDLFRIGKAEIEANPDGIDFSGPMFEVLNAVGYFTREAARDTTSTAYEEGIKAVMDNCDTAMGYVWLTTPENDRPAQIAAGRDWLRVNLAATAQGLGAHPLSQALQEYPEMVAYYRQIHSHLAAEGETIQMLARLGYGPEVPVSPRWDVEKCLIQEPRHG